MFDLVSPPEGLSPLALAEIERKIFWRKMCFDMIWMTFYGPPSHSRSPFLYKNKILNYPVLQSPPNTPPLFSFTPLSALLLLNPLSLLRDLAAQVALPPSSLQDSHIRLSEEAALHSCLASPPCGERFLALSPVRQNPTELRGYPNALCTSVLVLSRVRQPGCKRCGWATGEREREGVLISFPREVRRRNISVDVEFAQLYKLKTVERRWGWEMLSNKQAGTGEVGICCHKPQEHREKLATALRTRW